MKGPGHLCIDPCGTRDMTGVLSPPTVRQRGVRATSRAELGVSNSTRYDEVITNHEYGRVFIMGDRSDIYIVSTVDGTTSIGNHIYLHWGGDEALCTAVNAVHRSVASEKAVRAGAVMSTVLRVLFDTQDEVVVTPFAANLDEYVAQTDNHEHPVLVIDIPSETIVGGPFEGFGFQMDGPDMYATVDQIYGI